MIANETERLSYDLLEEGDPARFDILQWMRDAIMIKIPPEYGYIPTKFSSLDRGPTFRNKSSGEKFAVVLGVHDR